MDGDNALSDAEMRLIAVNGQTVMLEGDFENINMTNEFLNEMLMVSNSKVDISEGCNGVMDENSCANCVKESNGDDEPHKLEISIQGSNNELETVHIGLEEAKGLGLYFYGSKNDDEADSWNCTLNGFEDEEEEEEEEDAAEDEEESVRNEEEKVDGTAEGESCKMKFHSVPIVSVECLDRDSETLLLLDEEPKYDDASGNDSENFPCEITSDANKLGKLLQEDNFDNLPAIGHLEGFQMPTSEAGLLLPTTVNAKMVDGSYQTITLVPQLVNGAVTYTVHFSNLTRDVIDKNLSDSPDFNDAETVCDNVESANDEMDSVDEFLSSAHSIESTQNKKRVQDNLQKLSDCKNSVSGFINSLKNETVLKIDENITGTISGEVPIDYLHQNHLPIDAKIDNLISENESVISRCKKVKYGKKIKSAEMDSSLPAMIKFAKNNVTKTKKVKFKHKGLKFSSEESDQKKLNLSLLKPSNDYNSESANNKGIKSTKTNSMMHMNLNGRLEYPNLKAIDETASSLSYLKAKSPHATKQPYFNVLPCPKDKTIPVEKQILPLNCDLQQAKNLINLQKFLETQKLQLKIQPLASNGNKIINIRPKPETGGKEVNKDDVSKQLIEVQNENQLNEESVRDDSPIETQEEESAEKSFQDNLNIENVLLNERKSNNQKFLKSQGSDSGNGSSLDNVKEVRSACSDKLNGIFIKNNPEYFSQKFKDGNEDEHPLGSSENPIQLVQTGHTFHSRQPLSEAQLRQIASILQKQKFDSPNVKKNSIFDPKTNTRIVYRVVYPEDVELKEAADKNSADGITKRKRGRHKTKSTTGEDEVQKKPSPLPRGPGRPKKTPISVLEEDMPEEEIEETTPKKKIPRTRSGRLSRPPRYMVKDYKRLHNSDISEKNSNSNYDSDEFYSAYQNGKKVSFETENVHDLDLETNLLPGLRPQQRSKRNFKPEYRCPTCQKIYLGHTRMMWHLNKFPDHCNVEKYKENYYRKRTETKVRRAARRLNMCDVTSKVKQVLNSMSKDELTSLCGPLLADALTTWDFLLLRVNLLKGNMKDEVDALLHEFVLLLEKLTKIAEDIFLPVFSKEAERDENCVEIDRMEVAIALGLPVGFYKVNNDNLNLLRLPLRNYDQETKESETKKQKVKNSSGESEKLFPERGETKSRKLFEDKPDPWEEEEEDDKSGKKLGDNPFWLEGKVEDGEENWHRPERDSIKTLSTKFEPNLSSKLLESSNDSIDDGKYEDSAVRLIDLDSNSKDVEQSNSSGNMDGSLDLNLVKDRDGKMADMVESGGTDEKPSLWNDNARDKISSEELWNGNSESEKWNGNTEMVRDKSSELWTNENSTEMAEAAATNDKSNSHLWNENANLTAREKVDETNSKFLDSLLSVRNSNEFLTNGTGNFLSSNMSLMNEKSDKSNDSSGDLKKENDWTGGDGGGAGGRNGGEGNNYLRVWQTGGKNSSWTKEESILSGGLQERMPGPRTSGRLTSTPETNGSMAFAISNRRNSISDFSNINLEPTNLDVVLPSAKTLMKDCLKNGRKEVEEEEEEDDEEEEEEEVEKFEMKEGPFLEDTGNYKVKNWVGDSAKPDFASANVNSEDLMKMALESLTSQHDVINVPTASFDSAIGILNQNQEAGNLNLFAASETDALDFNLPLPEHLLRTNFAPANFDQTGCDHQDGPNNFREEESPPAFLSAANNIFGATCAAISNPIKFDQFETNFAEKKSKSLDDVIEFFDEKESFNGYGGESETSNLNNFPFASTRGGGGGNNRGEGYPSRSQESSRGEPKKKKSRTRKSSAAGGEKRRLQKSGKKMKMKKSVDYPKTANTIESIINEALFDSRGSESRQPKNSSSSPNRDSAMADATQNYSLPIISGSLDEVENLDFLSQD